MGKRDVIRKIQDYSCLTWDERAVTSGTGGTFLKARRKSSRGNVYYKLSCYDRYRGIYGHESVNELIASRLLDGFGIPHIPYRLVHANIEINGKLHETWMTESRDYRQSNERRQALDTYFELNARGDESPLDFCERMGWRESIDAMMAFDYLIINRDRHGANIEIVLKDGGVSLAPLFDHGLSFAYSCYGDEEQIRAFDAMADRPVNNYLGSRSLQENLVFVHRGAIHAVHFDKLIDSVFDGLEAAISDPLEAKMREILKLRWRHLVDIGVAVESDD